MNHDLRYDFITKKEIRRYFINQTNYRVNKLFSLVREESAKVGINMFSQDTVPTKLFCEYWNLDYKKFMKIILKGEV